MEILYRIIAIAIGYIFGLFNTGYIYGRLKGIDIREHGSGNAGTTNAMRVLGKKAGIMTYAGDMLKALISGCLMRFVFCGVILDKPEDFGFLIMIYTCFGVILGHNFPFYMGFKGGKGIAASSGVIAATLDVRMWIISILVFAIIVAVTKYVSVASMILLFSFFIQIVVFSQLDLLWGMGADSPYLMECYAIVLILAILSVVRHKANIVRLINGTENKVGQKRKDGKVE